MAYWFIIYFVSFFDKLYPVGLVVLLTLPSLIVRAGEGGLNYRFFDFSGRFFDNSNFGIGIYLIKINIFTDLPLPFRAPTLSTHFHFLAHPLQL